MKELLLFGLLLSGLASCKKDGSDPTPVAAVIPAPVTLQAFTATTGSFAIDTRVAAPPIILDDLQLQIVSQDDTAGNVTFAYTWRGHMPTSFYTISSGQLPAGTGIEVRAKFTVSKRTPLGKGPWYTTVLTYTTAPDFSNPKALDLAGNGFLTQTSTGYKLPFTAQFIDGSLTQ
jgi:uncharacterized lipoprotein YbaY